MRIATLIVLLGSSLVASTGFETVDTDELYQHAKRSIEEASEWFETQQRNGMLDGLQSSARRRGAKSSPESEKFDTAINVYERALEIIQSRMSLNDTATEATVRHLRQASGASCPNPGLNCFSSKYRTIDGSCNNLRNPQWGMAGRAQNRVASPNYDDGRNAPRGGQNSRLPNARVLSSQLHTDQNNVDPEYTNMVPQFGQFLDHDLSVTPEANSQCCQAQTNRRPFPDNNCWPIQIVSPEPFFGSPFCLDFTRSTPCIDSSGQRQQMNMNTAYIDGSMIYGSGDQRARTLRTFNGGRLVTGNVGLNGFLPTANQLRTNSQGTFLAGDDRINEMPGLAVMHNLFLMEHNRLAGLIQQLRPSMSDEQIYQEARRLVGAQIQNIVYNEYLPAILSQSTMQSYGLVLPPPGQYSTYNPNVDATIFNSFSTAAYRFGHTLVSGIVALTRVDSTRNFSSYNIANEYFQDRQVTQNNGQGYDWILRGLTTTSCQRFDRFVTTGMTRSLFATPNDRGSDLVARNIQRGRDHGLPSYNVFRNLCGLSRSNFNPGFYNSPDDVDLFVGSLFESPVQGGASGPTFNCLKAVQFARLYSGDRYFFTHGGQSGSFTQSQLAELRQVTLGDIICRNSQQIETSPNVFFLSNSMISCRDSRRNNMKNMAIFV